MLGFLDDTVLAVSACLVWWAGVGIEFVDVTAEGALVNVGGDGADVSWSLIILEFLAPSTTLSGLPFFLLFFMSVLAWGTRDTVVGTSDAASDSSELNTHIESESTSLEFSSFSKDMALWLLFFSGECIAAPLWELAPLWYLWWFVESCEEGNLPCFGSDGCI